MGFERVIKPLASAVEGVSKEASGSSAAWSEQALRTVLGEPSKVATHQVGIGQSISELARVKELSFEPVAKTVAHTTVEDGHTVMTFTDGSRRLEALRFKDAQFLPSQDQHYARLCAIGHEARAQAKAEGIGGFHIAARRNPDLGWKLHLKVPDDRDAVLTKAISEDLQARNIMHKVGAGGEYKYGKGMTVYVGDRDTTWSVAKHLHSNFGRALENNASVVIEGDRLITPAIGARFHAAVAEDAKVFLRYPLSGVGTPMLLEQKALHFQHMGKGVPHIPLSEADAKTASQSARLLTQRYGAFYTGSDLYRQAFLTKKSPESLAVEEMTRLLRRQ